MARFPTSVLVAHPGLQHSHQLALALHESGMLKGFWSGVPVAQTAEEASRLWLPPSLKRRVRLVDIPARLRRHPSIFQLAVKAGALFPSGTAQDLQHRAFHLFDRWVARNLGSIAPEVVVAYENSAYHTFKASKRLGAMCVLDASSLHYASAAVLVGDHSASGFRAEINRRKEVEIELADLIVTCSELAARSYIDNGVPPDKVRSIPLGAEAVSGIRREPYRGVPRFLFAGSLRYLKSIDLICEAFTRLAADGLRYELVFVGGADRQWAQRIAATPGARHVAPMPQKELFDMFTNSDCLLLPSRFESFGMVVAEAMACGTPAVVSRTAGACEIVEKHPSSGWLVDADVDSIYAVVRDLIAHPEILERARTHAEVASRDFTWKEYRAKAADILELVCGRGGVL